MDEKDKKIADLEKQIADATAATAVIVKERDQLKTDNTKLGQDIVAKDKVIELKNQDIIGTRREYKKLKDMTQEEKDQLTASELELKERMEKFEQEQTAFAEKVTADNKKQTDALRSNIFTRMAGKSPEIVKKLEENWGKIDKDLTGKATTEEEISRLATDAYNMIGTAKPAPVGTVVAGGGNGDAGGGEPANFADTDAGKQLSSVLGLPPEPKK